MTGPVNIPLLRKAVEWAEAEAAKPDPAQCQWYQEEFQISASSIRRDCGTCYCIAGYVLQISDQVLALGESSYNIAIRAGEPLGIDGIRHLNDFDEGLFSPINNIRDVRRIAEGIAAEAGERL